MKEPRWPERNQMLKEMGASDLSWLHGRGVETVGHVYEATAALRADVARLRAVLGKVLSGGLEGGTIGETHIRIQSEDYDNAYRLAHDTEGQA